MTTDRARPNLAVLCGIGLAAFLALVLLASLTISAVATLGGSPTRLAAQPAVPAVATQPVGTWHFALTVHSQEPPQHVSATCVFEANHHLRCLTLPGSPPLEVNGVWNQLNPGSFAFWATHHAQLDAQGNPTGSIYAEHLAVITPTTFSTHGFAFIDMHDGRPWSGPIPIEAVASRISD